MRRNRTTEHPLGPLPSSDRSAELQQLSFSALNDALPVERFVFRKEGDIDAGVDGTLELKYDGSYTNLRAQVQLKGTDSEVANADGSVSLQVDVSNLNYLLNGSSPVYIIHIASRDELRYLWAHDERDRLEKTKPDWLSQGQVSLRFANVLTPEALDGVYDRILREGRFQRSISELLSRAVPPEQVLVGIDPDSLAHTDPAEIKSMLEKGGVVLVAHGYASEVIQALDMMGAASNALPYFQLVRAYAQYSNARYDEAIAAAKNATLGGNQLGEDDRLFLELLKDSCELQSGRITLAEYEKRTDAWGDQLSGVYALGRRLDYLRHAIVEEEDVQRRIALIEDLRNVVDQILADNHASQPSKLQARIGLAYAEGQRFLFEFMREVATARIRAKLGFVQPPLGSFIEGLSKRFTTTLREFDSLVAEAVTQDHPLLLAEALTWKATILFLFVADMRIISAGMGVECDEPAGLLDSVINDVREAARIYSRANNLEGEIRAKLAESEVLRLHGEKEASMELAQEAHRVAQVMGYDGLAAHLGVLAEGKSSFDDTIETLRRGAAEDNDSVMASHDDELMKQIAAETLRAMGLPENRLPVALRDMLSIRDIARERIGWCQHIELIQDLQHAKHPTTYYQQDSDRHCLCTKHGYESLVGCTDWKVLIQTFKRTHCERCLDRSPKAGRDAAQA